MRALAAVLVALIAVTTPVRAQESEADPDTFSLGSEKDRTLELHGLFYLPGLKSRSHFGFGSDGFRNGEPNFGRDLGYSAFVPSFGFDATVNAGVFGFVGAELVHLQERGNVDQLDRLRRTTGIRLEEGDILKSSASFTWGGIEYGWEGRIRLMGWLDIALAPTLGVAGMSYDIALARLLPAATRDLGGRGRALVVAPGLRFRIEAFGLVRMGFEGDFGLTGEQLSLSKHYTTLWEHYRVFAGVNVLGLDVTVGWRMDATHLAGGGDYLDLRVFGAYVTVGARF